MKRFTSVFLIGAVAMTGCATSSKDVATSYVSPVQFQSYDCMQLQSEAVRIQSRVGQLGGRIDEAAANDKAIAGVGIILFWPALFALGGNKQQEAEFGRLKGEYEAIQQSSIEKKCGQASSAAVTTDKVAVAPTQKTNEEKLIELKRLHNAGLISPEIYSQRQKAILGD